MNSKTFHRAVCDAARAVRQRLASADLSNFRLDIEVSGRVQEGDVKVAYVLSDTLYGANKVEGHDLNAVTDEFLRRHGWNESNAPLLLESPDTIEHAPAEHPGLPASVS